MPAGKMFAISFAINAMLQGSFSGAMGKAGSKISDLQKKIASLNETSKQLNKIAQLKGYSESLTQELNATNKAIEKHRAELEKLQQLQDNVNRAEQAYGNAKNNFVSAISTAGMRLAPMVGAVQQAMKFESVMADVKKVVDFDTPQQFKEMSNDILILSQRIPMAAEGLASIVASGGQAGIAKADLLAFAESAAKMGVAFDITAEQAGDMMAKWRTAFKMNQAEVVTLADKINYLGNTTAAAAPLISDVVTRIGPLGEVGGVASGEIAALGASMVGAGIQSDVAATGIKNLILGMAAGTGATKAQDSAFNKLGMDAVEVARRMQVDAKGAILDVMYAIKDLSAEERAGVLTGLFGKESLSAITPLLSNLTALEDNFSKVADAEQYAGSMEAEFAARAETTENSLQLMKNNLSAIGINIGSAFLPAINDALKAVSRITARFAAWAGEHQGIIAGLGGLYAGTSVFKVLAAGADVVGAKITLLYSKFKWLRETLKAGELIAQFSGKIARLAGVVKNLAGVFRLLGTAIGFGPLGLAIGALAGAAYLLYSNWDMVVPFFSDLWAQVQNTFDSAAAMIQPALEQLQSAWAALQPSIEQMQAAFSSVLPVLGTLASFFGGVLIAAIYLLANVMAGSMSMIVNCVASAITGAIGILSGLIEFIEGVFTGNLSKALEGVKNVISSVMTAIRDIILGTINVLIDSISNIGNAVGRLMGIVSGGNSGGGTPIAANAQGGIYRKGAFLTTFAEDSAEAAIPLDGSHRAVSLWQKAGEILGVTSGNQTTNNAVSSSDNRSYSTSNESADNRSCNVFNAPPINITINITGAGNAHDIKKAVVEAGRQVQQSFAEQMAAFAHERGRVAFG